MTNKEAITTLKANYPDSCYEQLREAVNVAIKALEAQDAAGDTISRQTVFDALRTCYDTETVTMSNGDEYINYEDAVGEIEQLPSAQPERTGKWVQIKEGIKVSEYRCSECGRTVWDDRGYNPYVDYPYCHCGAKMEENNAKLD